MRIVDNISTVHFIAATRQRDPHPLTDIDLVRVGNPVHLADPLETNQPSEQLGRDGGERVPLLDDVNRNTCRRDAGSVRAGARDRHAYDLVRVHALSSRGGEWEVVGFEDRAEALHGEEGLDGGVRCGVLG